MSEQDFNFATTILTSKTPQQAAAIIPNVITGSTGVNKDLISWFKLYTTTMDKYNQGLQQLVDDAKRIAHRSNDGFNNFPRNWNCLLNAIQTEHDSNEVVNKNVKMEILNPLKELIEKDVRVSELVVNGQELQEISHNLNRDGEIQWNYKAPQSFQNLEDFKKVEIQLMFDIILNFFQIQNGKLTKDLKNNENSTNYLLGSYKFDHEMQTQLKYLVDTQFQIPHNANVAPAANPHEHKQRRMSSFIKQDNNKPTSPKKPSKLKSRVGSIFGRKKKKDKFDGGEAIPENGSTSEISLPVSRTRTSSSMLSRNNSTRRSFATREEPPHPYPKQVEQEPEHTKLQPAFPPLQPNHVQQPIAPTTPVHEKFLPPKPLPEPAESPNVVKYNDSDDSSTEERRASLLEKHELSDATPTGVTSPFNSQAPAPSTHVPGSRQSSDGIYSFEAGDDARPIQATPRTEQNGFEDPTLSPEKTLAPPPPPARKVLHHDEPSVRDSTVFHNLPTATNTGRDSIIAPLASQDTGHTLLKNDFKHQNLTTTSGLSSSIAEVINASFKDGELVKSQVIGEIAFNYNGTSTEPIAVNIPNEFKKVIVNKTFMDDLGSGNYKINPLSISAKTLGGLKYLLNPTEVPIIIQQIWKFEPHQSSLMVSIRSVVPLVLENFVVSVALNQDIQATSASSKPQGTFNEEKNRITWRYSQPLHLNGEERLIARFMTNGLGSEHESGVQIKFQVKDPQIKYCSIYADNQEIPTFRNLVSGSYSGHSVN